MTLTYLQLYYLKLKINLWYLAPEISPLAFFDDNVSVYEKRKTVEALKNYNPLSEGAKKVKFTYILDLHRKKILVFPNNDSNLFWLRMELPDDFLANDPASWNENESCKIYSDIVK